MDSPFVIALIVIGLAIASYFIYKKTKKKHYPAIIDRMWKITDIRTAPSGLTLMVEDGAGVNAQEIAAIEAGLTECFARARTHNYDRPLNLSDYKVAIIGDCERSPEAGIWSFRVDAGPYAGTEWDMGGYVLAAGQVLTIGTPHGNIIAIPEHQGTDLEELAQVAGYEAEHIILAHCDWPKFEATQVHGAGTGHPLF